MSIPSFGGPFSYPVHEPVSPVDVAQAGMLGQQIRGQNAMRQAFSQPDSIDPSTGQIDPNALRQIMAADPKAGMNVIAAMQQQQLRNSQIQHNQMLTALEQQQITDKQMAARRAVLPQIVAATELAKRTYDEQIDLDNPDAANFALSKGLDALNSSDRMGLLGGFANEARQKLMNMNMADAPELIRHMHAEIAKDKYAEGQIWVNDAGDRLLAHKNGDFSVFDTHSGQYGPYQGNLKGFHPANQIPPEMFAARAAAVSPIRVQTAADIVQAKAEAPTGGYGNTYEKMTPTQQEAVDWYATLQLGGDSTWRVGLGRARGGSDLIKAVDERVPQRAKELNLDPSDVGTNKAVRVASQAALTQNTKDLTTLKPYVAMLDQNSDILKGLAKKAILTNSALANRPLNWLRTNAADSPDVAEYLAQIEIVKNEATRVISNPRLVGQMTDTARQEIETIINGTMPLHATERVIDRIKNDGQRRITTIEDQQQALQGKIKKMFPGGKPEAPSIPATPAIPNTSTPNPGDVLKGYRFKGGDPSKQENWEKAS